ncbi:MAG TPA: site-2 protease family protein [Solirubrobacteraceae bacterium]|jgi:regulator of sigma E protease
MSYALAFLGFAALIILHEAGHFAAAKAVGMRVERFSLFFGPLLVKTRRGETEYGIGPIPLGGYVKITGMNPNEEIAEEHRARAYYNQPVWKRVVVILAGPGVNLLIAFAIVWVLLLNNGQPIPTKRVAAVARGSAAAQVLRPGDQLISVDGVRGSEPRLRAAIGKHHCAGPQVAGCVAATPARIVVRRDGRLVAFNVAPRYSAVDRRPELGFEFGAATHYPSVAGAASGAVSGLWSVTKQTVSTVARIFEPQERKQLSGVVGGYTVTQESFATNTSQALEVLALISLSLGVINLFPFLPLDGGHVFWAVAEKIRGKRIPFVVMERAGMVGFVLIILVFFIGLSNDVSTLAGKGFNVR